MNNEPKIPLQSLRWCLASALAALLLLTGAATLVTASPPPSGLAQPTAYIEPTPLPDGRVLYLVLKGDSLWKISAVTGVSIDELERLNNIRWEDPLAEGSTLLLKTVAPATVEPTLAFQASPSPSPLPVTGKGEICVSFFNDINGDASRNDEITEGLVAGGQISVALSSGTEMGATTSDGVNPYCFKDIPSGEYNIAAAAPENHNPTSEMNRRLAMEPGEKVYVSFAVQSNAPAATDGGTQGGGSPIVAIAGVALLVVAGLVLYSVLRPRRISRW